MKKALKNFPTPVVLIDQSTVSQVPTLNIKKQKLVFHGGFNPNALSNDQKNINAPKKQPIIKEQSISQITVYDEFGLIRHSQKKNSFPGYSQFNNKEKVFNKTQKHKIQENKHKQDYTILLSDKNKHAKLNEQYQIIKGENRSQIATHIKSTLDVIDLQGIEAKIEAHRRHMKPIEEEYRFKKGGNKGFQQQKEENDNQTKIYELIKNKQQQKLYKTTEQWNIDQMWEEKLRKDPKLASYDAKYKEYLLEKQAQNFLGSVVKNNLYKWDKYTTNQELKRRATHSKSKEKKLNQHKVKEQSIENVLQELKKSVANNNNKSIKQIDNNKIIQTKNKQEKQKATKDDKFIGQQIVEQIDISKKGVISKEELGAYLQSHSHLLNAYNIDLKWLYSDLDSFQTRRRGLLSRDQVGAFLSTLSNTHHPSLKLSKYGTTKQAISYDSNIGLHLSPFAMHKHHFQDVFRMLDINEDRLIKRQQYIAALFVDSKCGALLDEPGVIIEVIDKTVSYRQILTAILNEYRAEKNQRIKKAKEYISFATFSQYFDLKLIDAATIVRKEASLSNVECTIFDLPEEYLTLLKDIFDSIPRVYAQFVVAIDFVRAALKDPQIIVISEELCRIKSVQTNLDVENLGKCLNRMLVQCPQYANWDQIILYFSRRGRPLDYDLILIKKQIRKNKRIQNANIQKLQNKKNASQIIKENEKNNNNKTNNFTNTNLNIKNKSVPKYRPKYTIPQPFNLTTTQGFKLESSQQKQLQELNKKFKATPLNYDILEPKPDLIIGHKAAQHEYNYQNYENDRIQRVLQKAQLQYEEEQVINSIKKRSQIKAKDIKIDLKKPMKQVIEEQNIKKKKEVTKPIDTKLYPSGDQRKRKIEAIKIKQERMKEALRLKQKEISITKQKAKQHNEQIDRLKKKKEQEERTIKITNTQIRQKIKIKDITPEQKQIIRQTQENRERKRQQQEDKIRKEQTKRKQKIMGFNKKQVFNCINNLSLQQIIQNIEEIDFQQILLSKQEKQEFCKEYDQKSKTKKQWKEKLIGMAERERKKQQNQEKRLFEMAKQKNQQLQNKLIKQQNKETIAKNAQSNGTLDQETTFHKSKALRRYRAIMEGKQPASQFDQLSVTNKKVEI